jgi:trimeric autotransporter adhesin
MKFAIAISPLERALLVGSIVAVSLGISTPVLAQTRPSIADLQSQIAALQQNSVLSLDGVLTLDSTNPARRIARFSGVNVQVVNGTGSTTVANGLGNLIVGYDTVRTSGAPVCSIGQLIDQPTCLASGGVWAVSHKSGSHNLVLGNENNYSQTAGFVGGLRNTINANFANISSGANNVASSTFANVSAGEQNTASADYASVTGGERHHASGQHATVSGGYNNQATGPDSSVSGGAANIASEQSSSVSGGELNQAAGTGSSVGGGKSRSAPAADNWVAGGLSQAN